MTRHQNAQIYMVLLSFASGIVVTILIIMGALWSPVHAADGLRYVSPGGMCGAGITPCYSSIQEAVDAASEGEEIRVAAGIYNDIQARQGITQVVYISKTVSLRGGYTPSVWNSPDPTANPTILDAQGRGRVIYIKGQISPAIEGFHIIGGDASGLGGAYNNHDSGGGVYISNAAAVIKNCVIFLNNAYLGGGIYAEIGSPILYGNIISDNIAANMGGGIVLNFSSANVSGNTIISNTAQQGGGGYLYWDRSTLENNFISSNGSPYISGGGLYLQGGYNTINGNVIENNHAGYGGGILAVNASANINNNRISGNVTTIKGAGLYVTAGAPLISNNVIANNSILDNYSGSALSISRASPDLTHNTIINNISSQGAAIQIEYDPDVFSNVEITNTILSSHTLGISVTSGSTLTLNGVLWFNTPVTLAQATTASVSVINQWFGDPLFDTDGYHLKPDSAAIDKGTRTPILLDIDNQPRISLPDLGADEYWLPGYPKTAYLPLILR